MGTGLAADFFDHARDVDPKISTPCPKFQKCGDRAKLTLTSLLYLYPIWTVHVAGHKPSLSNTSLVLNTNSLYAYLIKFTLERISWFVRDQYHCHDPGDCRCHLVFSKNEALPYEDIKAYFRKLRNGGGTYNCRIDWKHISDDFETLEHRPDSELHIADIAAGALYHAIDPTKKKYAITDDRPIRNLRHSICRNERQVYGLKLFPSKVPEILQGRDNLDFYNAIINRPPALDPHQNWGSERAGGVRLRRW
jgi:hypothetical protein